MWRLTPLFPMEHWDGQTDVTHLVRTARFDPRPRVDLLAEGVHEIRWFSPHELAAGEVTFSPRDLHAQLAIVLAEGVPASVRDIEAL